MNKVNVTHKSCEKVELLSGDITLIQKKRFGRYNQDSIVMAEWVAPYIVQSEVLLEIGVGTGVIPLALQIHGAIFSYYIGIEQNFVMAELAKRNCTQLNCFVSIVEANFLNYPVTQKVDHIICNPPYYSMLSGKMPQNRIDREARFESTTTLLTLLEQSLKWLKSTGKIWLLCLKNRENELKKILDKLSLTVISRFDNELKLPYVTLWQLAYQERKQ